MRYFDTNILVHYFVDYDLGKYRESRELVREAVFNDTFHLSLLCVQETGFAMSKLKQTLSDINRAVEQMLANNPVGYQKADFDRACELAQTLGFNNINDCLHTAMAEAHGCTELLTYNRKDFVRIQPLTTLKIIILPGN